MAETTRFGDKDAVGSFPQRHVKEITLVAPPTMRHHSLNMPNILATLMDTLSTQKLPGRIAELNGLSHNLWWSWHSDARNLFKCLDRPLWKATGHNPVKLLQQIAPHRLVAAAEDTLFLKTYDAVMERFKSQTSPGQTWCSVAHPQLSSQTIAYFSMEFAIHNSLPMYAGGLGVLAGDYCKEAGELGLKVAGVGFMYPQGYFQQRLSPDGWQEEIYKELNFGESPVTPVLDPGQQRLKIKVELDSRAIYLTAWQVRVGAVNLYLLDTNVAENSPHDRGLSARLYGGDKETRLQQEIILGFGGVRLLRAMGIAPSIWHLNEGHTAFSVLERCRELTEKGMGFEEAAGLVKASTIFTTHTPVQAGNDVFSYGLMEASFHRHWPLLGLERQAFLDIGTQEPGGAAFNMTVLGIRMSRLCNGVSELHGAVCRRMWHCLWPDVAEADVPVQAVTNGIHLPTWSAPQIVNLFDRYLGPGWATKHDDPAIWEQLADIPDEEIWAVRRWLKRKLLSSLQDRARTRWSKDSGTPLQALAMGALLNAEALTIGFCRRFTDYKRGAMILHDLDRLKRILSHQLRPVQIIFSGKAHPSDERGKRLIQEVYRVAANAEFGGRIAFVEDYDIHIAHYLVQGVDVWLNTPRPLEEACGTSGMKAAVNGVPHFSVVDGWWYEGYDGSNGWAIDGTTDSCDPGDREQADAGRLYDLLEGTIVPLYYDRDLNGVPHGWIRVVKQAIRTTVPKFSARRMIKDYAENMYLAIARDVERDTGHPVPDGAPGR